MGKIDPTLHQLLQRAAPNVFIRVLIAPVSSGSYREAAQMPTRLLRHQVLVNDLQSTASANQQELLAYLSSQQHLQRVDRLEAYWIANIISAELTPALVTEIAGRPDVQMVYADYPIQQFDPLERAPAAEKTDNAVEPGVLAINVRPLWNLGYWGEDVLVMNCDTGVQGSHRALADRWRGLQAGVDPAHAWFNAEDSLETFPSDFSDHGTHTMGTMIGLDAADNDTIGVAPRAQWIAAGWNYGEVGKFISDVLRIYQWAIDPDGNPATVADVPAVMNNSWGLGEFFGQPPCDATFWEALDNMEAAGCALIFAAGNEGPGPATLRAPAERNTTPINTLAVGALNINHQEIATFSSRGPTACGGLPIDRIKPDIAARGVSVRSSVPTIVGFAYFSGTSMAAPHVSGAIALLREAFPDATVNALKSALLTTAIDVDTPGEDNNAGHGLIDVYAAYEVLQEGNGTQLSCTLSLDDTGSQPLASMGIENGAVFSETVDIWGILTPSNGSPELLFLRSSATIPAGGQRAFTRALNISATDSGAYTFSLVVGQYPEDIKSSCSETFYPPAAANHQISQHSITQQGSATVLHAYPNPFNSSVTIEVDLADPASVRLRIYSSLGTHVMTLIDHHIDAGRHRFRWNGRDSQGREVAGGQYFYRLEAGEYPQTGTILLIK